MNSRTAGAVLAAGAATIGFYYVWHQQQQQTRHGNDVAAREARTDSETAADFARRVREYMQRDLENLVIAWKRRNPTGTFERFMRENFKENTRVEDGRVVLDERVQGEAWRGTFQRLTAQDQLHELGPPPGDGRD